MSLRSMDVCSCLLRVSMFVLVFVVCVYICYVCPYSYPCLLCVCSCLLCVSMSVSMFVFVSVVCAHVCCVCVCVCLSGVHCVLAYYQSCLPCPTRPTAPQKLFFARCLSVPPHPCWSAFCHWNGLYCCYLCTCDMPCLWLHLSRQRPPAFYIGPQSVCLLLDRTVRISSDANL